MLSLLLRIWQTAMNILNRLGAIQRDTAELKAGQQRIEAQIKLANGNLDIALSRLFHVIDLLEPGPAVKLIFIADLEGQITYGVEKMDLRDDQQVTLSIQPVDKRGNPAALDGAPEWFSGNSEIATVEPAADGLSATVKAVGPLGATVISVKADADLGEGVTPLAGGMDINVVSGAATTLTVTAGEPIDQDSPTASSKKSRVKA